MIGRRYALHVHAAFFDRTIEETFLNLGEPIDIGGSGRLVIPLPEGKTRLARVHWLSRDRAEVTDSHGETHPLTRDSAVSLTAGPVKLTLTIAPQRWLPSFESPSARLTLGWAVMVVAATTFSIQADAATAVLEPYTCRFLAWLAPLHPEFDAQYQKQCVPKSANPASGGYFTAEYLERLLREDYAGAEDGSIELKNEEHSKKEQSFFLPAGAEGPATQAGGAEQVSAEPIRTQGLDEESPPPRAKTGEQRKVVGAERGKAVPNAETKGEHTKDGLGNGDNPDAEQAEESPSEEKKGWGVRDWYDASDERLEQQEIRQTLRYAKERLKINPDDPDALGILSYYQYLSQDYAGALATYDKYISLYPDQSAGYNNKALIYKRQRKYAAEEALYRQALSIEPDDVTALNNLAVNLAHQKRFGEALQIMQSLETLDPGDAYADLHRAKIHAEMGDNEKAYAYLEQSLEGMKQLDTLHHIEFRQDIRIDPSFEKIRETERFHSILVRYYGKDTPLQE